ncbi:MAG: M14 family metallopeptidase [Bacteroidales bacterium]|nr:M14 family metallopeptidase [Bacteroidales bacterium]
MKRFYLLLSGLLLLQTAMTQNVDWQTDYEKSGRLETPGYLATIDYCRKLAGESEIVAYTTFGKSPQGRDLPLLILDKQGLTDPVAIHASGRIILLVQACIHAGESEGKDAGLMLFRDLAIPDYLSATQPPDSPVTRLSGNLFENVSIIFIPIFNVDGHERFGPFNRINQNGPKEMGWRSTATNLNLNRDYLKADSPEMQAWLRMFNHWMPDFFIDIHTTDGADYQYVLTYLMEIYGDMDDGLSNWSKNIFIPGMESQMTGNGYPVFPYVGFRNWHDPRSGLITEVAPPMLSQGYTALRNRPGLLIETHMLKPYHQRVASAYECLIISLGILNKESKTLTTLIRSADQYLSNASFINTPFPLRFETRKDDSTMVDFLGMEYHAEKSDLSGGDWFKYSNTPVTMRIPYFSSNQVITTAKLPLAYIIPAEWAVMIERLKIHGVKLTELKRNEIVRVTTCRFKDPKWRQNPYEGRHSMTNIEYDEFEESRVFPAGSALVEVMQQSGRIIPHMLEPKGNGSFLSWGFFDAIFEQKEYGESYVIEKMAREMLANDPALKLEFDRKMSSDAIFANNPALILNWFYNKSPFGDNRKDVYPVGKIYDLKVLESLKQ